MYYQDMGTLESTHWKCQFAERRTGLCRARVTTFAGKIVRRWKEHNHTGNATAVEVTKLKEQMKTDAENTLLPPQIIVLKHLATASQTKYQYAAHKHFFVLANFRFF